MSGKPPFPGGTNVDKIYCHRTQEPVPLLHLNPRLPLPFVHIVGKMMAKDPAQRYPTARAVEDDLRAWAAGDAVQPPDDPEGADFLEAVAVLQAAEPPTDVTFTNLGIVDWCRPRPRIRRRNRGGWWKQWKRPPLWLLAAAAALAALLLLEFILVVVAFGYDGTEMSHIFVALPVVISCRGAMAPPPRQAGLDHRPRPGYHRHPRGATVRASGGTSMSGKDRRFLLCGGGGGGGGSWQQFVAALGRQPPALVLLFLSVLVSTAPPPAERPRLPRRGSPSRPTCRVCSRPRRLSSGCCSPLAGALDLFAGRRHGSVDAELDFVKSRHGKRTTGTAWPPPARDGHLPDAHRQPSAP